MKKQAMPNENKMLNETLKNESRLTQSADYEYSKILTTKQHETARNKSNHFASLRVASWFHPLTFEKSRAKLIIGSLACLLIFSSQIFAQRTARAADALFKEGQTLYGKGDAPSLQQALNKFDEARQIRIALKDKAGEAVALVFLGRTYAKLGNADGTVNNYLAAMEIFQQTRDKTGEAAVLNNLAGFLRDTGKFDEAIEYYEQAIPLLRQHGNKTDVAKALNGVGQTRLAMGDFQNAVSNLEESLKIWNTIVKGDDDKIRAIYNLGRAYFRLGNKAETVKLGNQALTFARQRNNPALEVEVLESLAQVYDETGDTKTAVDYRRKALETYQRAGRGKVSDNSFDTVVNNLADLYYRMGDLATAEKLLTQNIRSGVSGANYPAQSFILGTLGEVYAAKGEYEKATQHYNKSIELARQAADKNSEAYSLANLGLIYLNQSNVPQAIDNFNRALSFFPAGTNPAIEGKALSGLMLANFFTGNQNAAKQLVQRAENGNLDKGNSTWAIQVLYGIGLTHVQLKQHSQAIQKLEQSLSIAVERGNLVEGVNAVTGLGIAYTQAGNHAKALEVYDRAAKLWKELGNKLGETNTLTGAAWAALNLNQPAQATNYAQQALRITETLDNQNFQNFFRVSSFHILGKSAAHSKDSTTAINYYTQALTISERIGDAAGQKHFLNDIADAYEASGDKKQAKNYRNMAKKIKD